MRRLPTIGSVFLLLSVLLCGSACLMVPNLAKRLDEKRVTDRLQVGASKRQDVRKLLGAPKSATEHAWVHEWHTKKGWMVVGAGYQGGAAPVGVRGYRTLTVFDDADTLRGLEFRAELKRSDISAEDESTPIRSLDLPGCRFRQAADRISQNGPARTCP